MDLFRWFGMLWGFGILLSRVKSKTCPPRFYPSSYFGDDLVCQPCPLHYQSCKQQGKDQRRCKKHCGTPTIFTVSTMNVPVIHVSRFWITLQTDQTKFPNNKLSISTTDLLPSNHAVTSDTTEDVLIAIFVLLIIIIVLLLLGCIYKYRQNTALFPRSFSKNGVMAETADEEHGNFVNYVPSSL
ncbi:uncharacterized protein LOC124442643 [Xenia sp. Carnegie-2017]|uniref:uncharacterized protein LOC124442643 n=1 Tax=Xenia sp. Carnegie-2017 TaxID=2897299 RepID=UPI001F04FBCB|nr:uncharacterized protein LOC124442643 [Xenia sp. Carnegie-2017]